MTFPEFDAFLEQLEKDEKAVMAVKGPEYARGDDRFGNFKRTAIKNNNTPLQVAWGHMSKHLDSIESYILTNGRGPLSEPIYQRILDARNYLALIAGMIEEKEKSDLL